MKNKNNLLEKELKIFFLYFTTVCFISVSCCLNAEARIVLIGTLMLCFFLYKRDFTLYLIDMILNKMSCLEQKEICRNIYITNKKNDIFSFLLLSISLLNLCYCDIKSDLTTSMVRCSLGFIIWVVLWIVLNKDVKTTILNFFCPVYLLILIEFMQGNIKAAVYCLCNFDMEIVYISHLIFCISLLIIYLTGKLLQNTGIGVRASLLINGAFYYILGTVNHFMIDLTGHSFILPDILSAKTALNVAGTQKFSTEGILTYIISLIFLILYILIIIRLTKDTKKEKEGIAKRLIKSIASIIFISTIVIGIIASTSILVQYCPNLKYGFIYSFCSNLQYGISYPDGTEEYVLDKEELKVDTVSEENPNVIIIMNEAFSDINKSLNIQPNKDPLEYFHSLQRQYPSGITYSSVNGNNTVSSEWEAMSGVSTALTNKGAVTYQQNCRYMYSLVDTFNKRGYYTVGYHCGKGDGYNRNNVYKELGYDKTYFLENIKTHNETIRGYVSDKDDYKDLINIYKKTGKQPLFCFNVTIQNHGGYSGDKIKETIKLKNATNEYNMAQYFSLLKKSDDALKYLINYFNKVDEPTVILFFGDHQPVGANNTYYDMVNKDQEEISLKDLSKQYQIPYFIWSNYDTDKSKIPAECSINYFPKVLFDVAGLNKTEWIEKLDQYFEKYPVVTENFIKNNKGEIFTFRKDKLNKTLKEYQMYSYGILKGN